MGRTFQHIRLRSKGPTKEGRPVERHHRRILHRRLARCTRRIQVDAQRRDIVRHSSSRHRRCLDRFQPHDGRQHQARGSPATTHRRRCITKRRPCSARVNFFFDIMALKWEFYNFKTFSMGWDERMLFGWFAFTAPDLGGRRSHSPQLLCYTLYHTDMICTTSGGFSRRRHELMESCSAPRPSSTDPLISQLLLTRLHTLTILGRNSHLGRYEPLRHFHTAYKHRRGHLYSTHAVTVIGRMTRSNEADWYICRGIAWSNVQTESSDFACKLNEQACKELLPWMNV